MPVDLLQSFFAALDPLAHARQIPPLRPSIDPDGDQAAKFVALEDWLNDGVGLAAPVARECLQGNGMARTPPGAASVAD